LCLRAFFPSRSARDHSGGGESLTQHIFAARQAYPLHRAMGLAERELERHRHLDDLLSYLADTGTHARDSLPRDVQDVFKRRRDAHRIRRAPFHPRNLSRRHSGPRWTAHLCVWLCLEHFLC
jgi:hypothetical protein